MLTTSINKMTIAIAVLLTTATTSVVTPRPLSPRAMLTSGKGCNYLVWQWLLDKG